MYALYRKGRKNTLAYLWRNLPAVGTDTFTPCWIALVFENRDAVKNYLLTIEPEKRAELEMRPVTLKCPKPPS